MTGEKTMKPTSMISANGTTVALYVPDSWIFGRYRSRASTASVTTATMLLNRPALISHL